MAVMGSRVRDGFSEAMQEEHQQRQHPWSQPVQHKTQIDNSTPINDQSRKLKASCDFCALSKVKCDRGQPQCKRCIRSGVVCHYSESRRICKVRQRYSQSGFRRDGSSLASGDDQFWNDLDFQASVLAGFPTSNPLNAFSAEETYPEASDAVLQMERLGTSSPGSSQSNTIKRAHNGVEAEAQNSSFLMSNMQLDGFLSASSNGTPSPPLADGLGGGSVDMADAMSCFGPGTDADHGHCMARACKTLCALHSTARCSFVAKDMSDQHAVPHTIDATLSSTNAARLTVEQILSCDCVNNWNTHCILLLIVHQAIERYSTLTADLTYSTTKSSTTTTASRTTAPSRTNRQSPPHSLDISLSIGSHVPDASTRMRVIMQVLRSEMEAIGKVIDRLTSLNVTVQKEAGSLEVLHASVREKHSMVMESLTLRIVWCAS